MARRRTMPHVTRRRDATPAGFKALAHRLRMRILRVCLRDALTNKEIADRLGQDPATIEEYAARPPARSGAAVGLHVTLHHLAPRA